MLIYARIYNKFLLGVDYVDVVQIVEVLAIEPSKNEHTASQETSAVSSSGFGDISLYLCSCYLILLGIQNENIVEIVAEPASEYVNFVIKDS